MDKNHRVSVRAKEEEASLEAIQNVSRECEMDEHIPIGKQCLCQHIKQFVREFFQFPGETQDRAADSILEYMDGKYHE